MQDLFIHSANIFDLGGRDAEKRSGEAGGSWSKTGPPVLAVGCGVSCLFPLRFTPSTVKRWNGEHNLYLQNCCKA